MTQQQLVETPIAPATHLPVPNIATISMMEANEENLRTLRAEQHMCDDMVNYWTTRHADVTRSIEAIQAATQALNRVAPRTTTRLVTDPPVRSARKPKAKPDA